MVLLLEELENGCIQMTFCNLYKLFETYLKGKEFNSLMLIRSLCMKLEICFQKMCQICELTC